MAGTNRTNRTIGMEEERKGPLRGGIEFLRLDDQLPLSKTVFRLNQYGRINGS